MHINMKKKSLFKRVSGVLTGVFFSTSFILAANENGQLFGSETLIVVVALLLLFVPLFLYVRKLHSNMNDRSDRIIKENAALESLNKEISSQDTGFYGSRMTIWRKPIVIWSGRITNWSW